MNKSLAVFLFLGLSACSHEPAEKAAVDAEIAGLGKAQAVLRLTDTEKELQGVTERLGVTRARRDNLQLQATSDVNKQNAVDGTEAEIAALQQKRAELLHRQHSLEARLRELED